MDRSLQSTPATLSVTFTVDGVATDPSPATVTVEILRADGTVLVAAGTSTGHTGVGTFAFSLTAAQTALLDTLTARWTSTNLGTIVTTQEIVGGFVCSTADLRSLFPDTAAYPNAVLHEMRNYAETSLENALGFALVPRYSYETINLRARTKFIRTAWPYIRSIRSVSVGGVAYTSTQLALLTTARSFVYGTWPVSMEIDGEGGWSTGIIKIGYEHGVEAGGDLAIGARRASLAVANDYGGGVGSIDSRAETIVTVDGTIRLRGGGSGSLFTAAGVDSWVQANREVSIA